MARRTWLLLLSEVKNVHDDKVGCRLEIEVYGVHEWGEPNGPTCISGGDFTSSAAKQDGDGFS